MLKHIIYYKLYLYNDKEYNNSLKNNIIKNENKLLFLIYILYKDKIR